MKAASLALILTAAVGAAACGRDDRGAAGAAAPPAALDDRAMMRLQDRVMGAKLADAAAATEAVLGPARAKADDEWQYARVQGDTCYHFGLVRRGDVVHAVQNGSFDQHDSMYAECARLAAAPAVK